MKTSLKHKGGYLKIVGNSLETRNSVRGGMKSYALAGAEASVTASGAVYARRTVTRTLIAGPFAPSKKEDKREVFLTISGSDFQLSFHIDPQEQGAARSFAAAVNTAAKTAGQGAPAPQMPTGTQPPPPPSAPAGWYPDPSGSPSARWFDGVRWTEHTQQV